MNKKTKTFYPDLSKNYEMIQGLDKILNRKESSISMCYITMSTSNTYTLFFESFQNNSLNLTFNFHYSSDILHEEDHQRYIKKGFAREDLELLSQFLSDFALDNIYESSFFGSLFFVKEFREFTPFYILKYVESEDNNRFLIDGLRLSRHYAVETIKSIKYALEMESKRINNKQTTLLPCNSYILKDFSTLENAIENFNRLPIREDRVIVEYYQDYETKRGFLKSVFKVVNAKLEEININA